MVRSYLHGAVGSFDIVHCVKLLEQNGANMNNRTNGGRGASALFLAKKYHGKGHPVSSLLAKKGAQSRSPTIEM
jgi:hypothetical protein